MNSLHLTKIKLPDAPGVYFFLGPKKEILYIGKATSLKDRVKSYFGADLVHTRGERLVEMVERAAHIEYKTADSVLEALLLEANEIHTHQPPYNTLGKDDKSFNYVIVTKDDFPRILTMRGRELEMVSTLELESKISIDSIFGPFPHSGELRAALKIIRKIFPYRDTCIPAPEQKDPLHLKRCWNAQIGLCPGVCSGQMDKKEYRKVVKRIKLFFQGKKGELVKTIERDMQESARRHEFEQAEKLKRMLYALEHIQDVALIKRDIERVESEHTVRIEAYDIAHLSGSSTVGVMTVVEDGELQKSQYRKFRIRGVRGKVTVDDTKNLQEMLRRRFAHPEWQMPQIIVVDGGLAQINAAQEVLAEHDSSISVVSVVKDTHHKAREILGSHGRPLGTNAQDSTVSPWSKSIILANVEAHRFAIAYHRKLRGKGFRI